MTYSHCSASRVFGFRYALSDVLRVRVSWLEGFSVVNPKLNRSRSMSELL